MIRTSAAALALSLLASSALAQGAGPIDPARLSQITRTLASDAFEGRGPGTTGEDRTVEYLVREFKALGLEPAEARSIARSELPPLPPAPAM